MIHFHRHQLQATFTRLQRTCEPISLRMMNLNQYSPLQMCVFRSCGMYHIQILHHFVLLLHNIFLWQIVKTSSQIIQSTSDCCLFFPYVLNSFYIRFNQLITIYLQNQFSSQRSIERNIREAYQSNTKRKNIIVKT